LLFSYIFLQILAFQTIIKKALEEFICLHKVFVSLPVKDVDASIAFYEKLGFKKNEEFSTEQISSMVWDDNFWIMLLDHLFYQLFIKDRTITDTNEENGGSVYKVDMGIPEDQMDGLEVVDLDGNTLEPIWMQA